MGGMGELKESRAAERRRDNLIRRAEQMCWKKDRKAGRMGDK